MAITQRLNSPTKRSQFRSLFFHRALTVHIQCTFIDVPSCEQSQVVCSVMVEPDGFVTSVPRFASVHAAALLLPAPAPLLTPSSARATAKLKTNESATVTSPMFTMNPLQVVGRNQWNR
jgi:hypothetical protein